LARQIALTVFITVALTAHASDHGGGGASGPEPMQFTLNVGDTGSALKVLQVTMVLEFAKPEASHHLAEIKPKVQHRIILLLSGENVASLRTLKGKQELQERIADDLNQLIDKTVKTGVKEVLFTNFIIQ
jgi:flagellar FliL protein